MSKRPTLKQRLEETENELRGAYTLLAVILAGVGGQLILSQTQIEELAAKHPSIEAYVVEGTDAFLVKAEFEDDDE